MNESTITSKLIKQLNIIPGCFARKRHGSAYCSGDPDVHICYKGHTIFIEVKMLDGKLSDLQALTLQRWQDAGATCVLGVWDPEQQVFALFSKVADWKAYIGPVKPHIKDPTSKYFYCAMPKEELLDALNSFYE